jgi:hypothetical protein
VPVVQLAFRLGGVGNPVSVRPAGYLGGRVRFWPLLFAAGTRYTSTRRIIATASHSPPADEMPPPIGELLLSTRAPGVAMYAAAGDLPAVDAA